MTTAEELAANAQKRAQDEKNNAASLTGDGLPVAQENAESTTQSGYANKLNRQVARGEIDQGQADVLLKNSPPEMAGPSAPAPAPAQNQAPSAPANTNGMGVDTNDGGRIVSYGRQMARYDKNGNIVGWSDANGNAVETPKSMQMMAAMSGPGKGENVNNRFGVTNEENNPVAKAQKFAMLSRHERNRRKAQYNIEVGNSLGVALQDMAYSDRPHVTEKATDDKGNVVNVEYAIGVVGPKQISAMNEKLQDMGRHTIRSITAYQQVNAQGRLSGEPQFIITYNKDGARTNSGETFTRRLTKQQVMDTMDGAFKDDSDIPNTSAANAVDRMDTWSKSTFKDYYGQRKAEKQAEEDRSRKIQSENNTMHTALLKALGDAGMGMGTRDTVRGVANDQKLMESLRYVERVVYEKDANGNVVKDANGQPKPMVDPVTNVTITEKIPLSDEQVLARVAQFKNRNGGGGGEVGFLNSYGTGADIPQKVAEMALRNLGYETPKMRRDAQAAQTQAQRSLEDIQGRKAELLRLKAQQDGGAQAPTAPAPTANAPAAPQNPNPAPAQSPQTPAQPAQTQFVPQEQPTGGPMNIVSDLSRQTFGEPNPAAQKPYPTAQAQTNPQTTEDVLASMTKKPNESDVDFEERKQNIVAKQRKDELSKIGIKSTTSDDGDESYELTDYEFLTPDEQKKYPKTDTEIRDWHKLAQETINSRRKAFEELRKKQEESVRREAIKEFPTNKKRRNAKVSVMMDKWDSENDPRKRGQNDIDFTASIPA